MPSTRPRPLQRSWHGPAAVALLASLVVTLTRASTVAGDTGKVVPANHRHVPVETITIAVESAGIAGNPAAPDLDPPRPQLDRRRPGIADNLAAPDLLLVPNSTGVGPVRILENLATVSATDGGRAVPVEDLSNYVPPIFIRDYFVETGRGTLKVGIGGDGVWNRSFYCNPDCGEATGCWQSKTRETVYYVLQRVPTKCVAATSTEGVTWLTDGIRITSRSVGASGEMRTLSIVITCDPNDGGDVNFTLTATGDPEAADVALTGKHRCACAANRTDPECVVLGVAPKSEIDSFVGSVTDAIAKCNEPISANVIVLVLLACGIIVTTVLVDFAVACSKQRSGLEGVSWFDCFCCSCCNVFAHPPTLTAPCSDGSEYLLHSLGTASISFLVGNVALGLVSGLYDGLIDEIGGPTRFAMAISVVFVVYTFPLTACASCSFKELGSLLGFVYATFGAYTTLTPSVCYVGTSIPEMALLTLPSAACFIGCMVTYLLRLFPCMLSGRRIVGENLTFSKLHLSLTVQGPAANTFQAIPDTSAYVRAVFNPTDGPADKMHWVTGGEVRMLTAQALTSCMICAFLAYLYLFAELLAIFVEYASTSGRCCSGESCYAAVGAGGISDRAAEWRPGNEHLTVLDHLGAPGLESTVAVSLPGSCATYTTVKMAIAWTVLGCGYVSAICLVWHFYAGLRRFRNTVRLIQSGATAADPNALKAAAGTQEQIGMLKYIGTQTVYALIGWVLNTALGVIVGLVLTAVVVLPAVGLYPGADWDDVVATNVYSSSGPQWLTVLALNYVLLYAFVYSLRNKNAALLGHTSSFESFFYTINGLGSLFMRVVLSLIGNVLCWTRLDVKVVPGPRWADPGHAIYCKLIQADSFYSNKTMLYFARSLLEMHPSGGMAGAGDMRAWARGGSTQQEEGAHQGNAPSTSSRSLQDSAPLLSHGLNDEAGFQDAKPAKPVHRVARNRWYLAYTLIKNPELVIFRDPNAKRLALATFAPPGSAPATAVLSSLPNGHTDAQIGVGSWFRRETTSSPGGGRTKFMLPAGWSINVGGGRTVVSRAPIYEDGLPVPAATAPAVAGTAGPASGAPGDATAAPFTLEPLLSSAHAAYGSDTDDEAAEAFNARFAEHGAPTGAEVEASTSDDPGPDDDAAEDGALKML